MAIESVVQASHGPLRSPSPQRCSPLISISYPSTALTLCFTSWLAALGPILWDFGSLLMLFWRNGHRVTWHGLAGPLGAQLHAMSSLDVLPALLAEFEDVFTTPMGLPPPRARDPLTSSRAHCQLRSGYLAYPQIQKELECQCHVLEAQGLIRRSTSPSSAPVLLVKKSDGTWRLCEGQIPYPGGRRAFG